MRRKFDEDPLVVEQNNYTTKIVNAHSPLPNCRLGQSLINHLDLNLSEQPSTNKQKGEKSPINPNYYTLLQLGRADYIADELDTPPKILLRNFT